MWRLALFALAACVKLLLLHSYRSTDFEVHRGWMAITSSLPISQWYVDATSEWTLDYPPLFAWFEWLLALGAPLFDRGMLVVSATPYASPATILYQRLTVIATDAALLLGSHSLAAASTTSSGRAERVAVAVSLTVLNAGLILVDHVHFQYNGVLIGILLLSCGALASGRERWAAAIFAVLLNMKHLFLFAAPLFFVQLLRRHVLGGPAERYWPPGMGALRRLLVLACLVLGVFALSLGPFAVLGQLSQLGARLFPFGRGLTHAYWAPNAWALYTFADRLGAAVAKRLLGGGGGGLGGLSGASKVAGGGAGGGAGGSSGVVGETAMLLLPSVGAATTAALVLLAQSPVLIGTWRAPRRSAFAPAVAYCGLAAYCFGYHVHEKALLPPMLVLASLSPPPAGSAAASLHARILLILGVAGHYCLLPLLHGPSEWALARLLSLAYLCAMLAVLRARLGTPELGLRAWEALYLAGFVPLEAFCSAIHPLLLAPRMPFLPLMATSVYCALGVLYVSGLSYLLWREYSCGRAGRHAMD